MRGLPLWLPHKTTGITTSLPGSLKCSPRLTQGVADTMPIILDVISQDYCNGKPDSNNCSIIALSSSPCLDCSVDIYAEIIKAAGRDVIRQKIAEKCLGLHLLSTVYPSSCTIGWEVLKTKVLKR
jgi:hypothetical protein